MKKLRGKVSGDWGREKEMLKLSGNISNFADDRGKQAILQP